MESRANKRIREVPVERKNPLLQVLDQIIRFRYVIGIIFLVLIVALNLNGSSIGSWDKLVSERSDGKTTDVIFGKNRKVRSDEWLVQTPFYLSQVENDYSVVNKNYSLNGQNMIIAYNSPVKDITVIGKPFNWGFFFLGKDRGLSFYWGFKIIGMLLLCFELFMVITQRNRYLSLLGSFAVAFSPAVQWWFMQHVGDLIFFSVGLMVAFYHYFYKHDKKWVRMLMMFLVFIFGLGFILVIYPAHQVMLGYLLLIYFFGLLIHFRKIRWDKFDMVLIVGTILTLCGLLFHFWWISRDALASSLGTVYPGKRVSKGGNVSFGELFYFLTNWKISFKDISFSNNSEVAFFYNFFPTVFLASPFVLFGSGNRDKKLFGRILMIFCLFSLFWSLIGLPKWLAKITLLSYVPGYRSLTVFSFASCLLTIWFIAYIWRENVIPIGYKIFLIVVNLGMFLYAILNSKMVSYFSQSEIIATVLLGTLLLSFILFRKQIPFFVSFATLIIASGFFVNPVVEGTGAIFEKTLAKEIQKINTSSPSQLWLTEDEIYNFTPTLGVKSFNTVRFYPDMKAWKIIDPDKKYENYYNRYAHIRAFIAKEDTKINLDRPDMISLVLNFEDAKKIGIRYVVTKRPLNDYNQLNEAIFTPLYGPDKDGYRIFEVSYSSP